MSGIETVKIIVDAEKEAANLLKEANQKALEIKKNVDGLIETERQTLLAEARSKASAIIKSAETDGRTEAAQEETQSIHQADELLKKATANKESAATALYNLIVG